jgi:RNA polymerase sigma-70 factor (ECF subfamily)
MNSSDTDREGAKRSGALRTAFLQSYPQLVRSLAHRLGSVDRAREALHEVWLKLERGGKLNEVRDPGAYLARAAINADYQSVKTGRRQQALLEANFDRAVPETPDLEDVVAWRAEWEAMRRAVDKLPPRRRAIFIAAYGEELPLAEIAERHGVTVRTVQMDLKAAFEQLSWEVES